MRLQPTSANHTEKHPRQRRSALKTCMLVALASPACAPVDEPDIGEQTGSVEPALPVILKDRGSIRMEALVSGRITVPGHAFIWNSRRASTRSSSGPTKTCRSRPSTRATGW